MDLDIPVIAGDAGVTEDHFARKRRAAAIIVPTDDGQVRARLRELGEPITLFGEDKADRRDRLRSLLADELEDGYEEDAVMRDAAVEGEADEEFYTRGVDELLAARRAIARYSLPRTKLRVACQKVEAKIPLRTHVKHRKVIKEKLQAFELQGSQTVGDRPVSITRFAPNGEMIATGTWSGGLKLLDVPTLTETKTLRGHKDRVGGISWHPSATLPEANLSPSSANLVSGGGDGSLYLWSLNQETPLASLEGHNQRVCRVEFHPSGRYVASASEDTTWRLWDVETTAELLLQEGHSRGVFAVSFNADGSLIASGGLDSLGRIWDLRTGRTVMILDGHIRPIHALDWGVDGYRVLSGSADGWVKCWDLRKVQQAGGIGAHRSVVSDLRWFKGLDHPTEGYTPVLGDDNQLKPKISGSILVSAGFDKQVNIFSADDWSLIQSLGGHTGNIHSVDVTRDARWIVSGGFDRTVKLWGRNDAEGLY